MKLRGEYTYPLELTHDMIKGKRKQMLDTLAIMQAIGINFMLDNGMKDILKEKSK